MKIRKFWQSQLLSLFALLVGCKDLNSTNTNTISYSNPNEELLEEVNNSNEIAPGNLGNQKQKLNVNQPIPSVVLRKDLQKPVSKNVGPLAFRDVQNNSINASLSEIPISLNDLEKIQAHPNKDEHWVINSLGDTVKTGVPLILKETINKRIQLPRESVLSPSYKDTDVP